MRFAPIKQLTYFEGKFLILRRERAAVGEFGKRSYFLSEFLKPSQARPTGLPFQKPI